MPEVLPRQAYVQVERILVVIEFHVPSGPLSMSLPHFAAVPVEVSKLSPKEAGVLQPDTSGRHASIISEISQIFSMGRNYIPDMFVKKKHRDLVLY